MIFFFFLETLKYVPMYRKISCENEYIDLKDVNNHNSVQIWFLFDLRFQSQLNGIKVGITMQHKFANMVWLIGQKQRCQPQ